MIITVDLLKWIIHLDLLHQYVLKKLWKMPEGCWRSSSLAQIKVIYEAAEADLNLEHYMNPKFSASHMKFIMEQEKAGKDVTWLPDWENLHRSIVEKPLTRDQIRRIKERMQRAEPKDSVDSRSA